MKLRPLQTVTDVTVPHFATALFQPFPAAHSSPADQLTGAAVSSLFLPILTPPNTKNKQKNKNYPKT
jgi:hypothetical protein